MRIKQLFCRHKNWEYQWFLQSWTIRYCKDCEFVDYGVHEKRYLFFGHLIFKIYSKYQYPWIKD
jgi:hypothetical protein